MFYPNKKDETKENKKLRKQNRSLKKRPTAKSFVCDETRVECIGRCVNPNIFSSSLGWTHHHS